MEIEQKVTVTVIYQPYVESTHHRHCSQLWGLLTSVRFTVHEFSLRIHRLGQLYTIKQQVDHIAMENPHVVIEAVRDIHPERCVSRSSICSCCAHIKLTTQTAQVSCSSAGSPVGLMQIRQGHFCIYEPVSVKNPVNFLLSPDYDKFPITARV